MSRTLRRCGPVTVLATGLAAATISVPTAAAQPQCTAAALTGAIGTVSAQTSQFLAGNPDANQAITDAGNLPAGQSDNAIRAYFVAHPQQWAELQRIAQPLRSLRQQCQADVVPADIARLFDAMAG